MHIDIDQDKCIASGACVLAAPDNFDQDDDGIVVLVQDVDGEPSAQVLEAVRACPAAVLALRA